MHLKHRPTLLKVVFVSRTRARTGSGPSPCCHGYTAQAGLDKRRWFHRSPVTKKLPTTDCRQADSAEGIIFPRTPIDTLPPLFYLPHPGVSAVHGAAAAATASRRNSWRFSLPLDGPITEMIAFPERRGKPPSRLRRERALFCVNGSQRGRGPACNPSRAARLAFPECKRVSKIRA